MVTKYLQRHKLGMAILGQRVDIIDSVQLLRTLQQIARSAALLEPQQLRPP